MTELSPREMRGSLLGYECRCGNTKASGKSFCRECWNRLPRDIGRRLYRLIGDGYEAAYTAACRFLEGEESPPRFMGKVL